MPRVGFEPTVPVFERAKTVHALDRAAAVFGKGFPRPGNIRMKVNNAKWGWSDGNRGQKAYTRLLILKLMSFIVSLARSLHTVVL
jgi:hypothetical protein